MGGSGARVTDSRRRGGIGDLSGLRTPFPPGRIRGGGALREDGEMGDAASCSWAG
jgi:hypothetical protein